MNPVELLDILPLLYKEHPKAALLYSVAKGFCNKKGELQIKLFWLAEHLKFSNLEMKEACSALQSHKLISKTNDSVVLTDNDKFKSLTSQSVLRRYASEEIPLGYEVLLQEKEMYDCYITLGTQLWKVLAQIANYFRLDFPTLTRLMYNADFKKRFLEVRKQVEKTAEITGQRVTKRKKAKGSKKTITELTEQLINEIHIRNDEEIPRSEWKAPQLLRVFVLIYKKRYNEDYVFTSNPFSSYEMKEIKAIASAFDENSFRVIAYLQWCFAKKSYQQGIMNPLRIRFCSSPNVIQEYIRSETSLINSPEATKGTLSDQFMEWLKKNHKDLQETYQINKFTDMQWIKEAYQSKSLPDELVPIIKHALEQGVFNE